MNIYLNQFCHTKMLKWGTFIDRYLKKNVYCVIILISNSIYDTVWRKCQEYCLYFGISRRNATSAMRNLRIAKRWDIKQISVDIK
jgi:hypothetical protein